MASQAASNVIHDNWFNPPETQLSQKERVVQSAFFNLTNSNPLGSQSPIITSTRSNSNSSNNRPTACNTNRNRPYQLLRLNSAGEGDSSPDPEEDLSDCNFHNNIKKASCPSQSNYFGKNPSGDTVTRPNISTFRKQDFSDMSNQHYIPKREMNTTHYHSNYCQTAEAKHLNNTAQSYRTCKTPDYLNTHNQGTNMSQFRVSSMNNTEHEVTRPRYGQTAPANPKPAFMNNTEYGQIRSGYGQTAHPRPAFQYHQQSQPTFRTPWTFPFMNMSDSSSNSQYQHPVQRGAPPEVMKPVQNIQYRSQAHQNWVGYPLQMVPPVRVPPNRYNLFPQAVTFSTWNIPPKCHNMHVRKTNNPRRKTFCKKKYTSGKEKMQQPTPFTKILQRPTETNFKEQLNEDAKVKLDISMHDTAKVEDNAKTQISTLLQPTKTCHNMTDRKNLQDCNSDDKVMGTAKNICESTKRRHYSIEFLLADYKPNTVLAVLSDSDFVEGDWDILDGEDNSNLGWEEHFLDDDPYNPLTGWRCQKKTSFSDGKEESADIDHVLLGSGHSDWADCNQGDYDSGTESGSEGESSDEDVINDDEESDQVASANETLSKSVAQHVDLANSEQTKEQQTSQNLTMEPKHKCLHPSIDYILGRDVSSEEDEDDSSDWDSFDDSDGDEVDESCSASRDTLNLFQFSNDRFNPLNALHCKDGRLGSPLVFRQSSSEPHIFVKPKPRTLVISQRLICQVSENPVSLVVPLEQNGKISQTSIPTIYCEATRPSQQQSFPTSCFKSPKNLTKRHHKKVHFNNKAMLIICPEPSHLVDEIKSTRKGPWLDYARDRCRFQNRIRHMEPVISPCLTAKHRENIMQQLRKLECSSC